MVPTNFNSMKMQQYLITMFANHNRYKQEPANLLRKTRNIISVTFSSVFKVAHSLKTFLPPINESTSVQYEQISNANNRHNFKIFLVNFAIAI